MAKKKNVSRLENLKKSFPNSKDIMNLKVEPSEEELTALAMTLGRIYGELCFGISTRKEFEEDTENLLSFFCSDIIKSNSNDSKKNKSIKINKTNGKTTNTTTKRGSATTTINSTTYSTVKSRNNAKSTTKSNRKSK